VNELRRQLSKNPKIRQHNNSAFTFLVFYTKVEMDGVICKHLLTENSGTKKEYVKSKSDLNRAELAKFIDNAIILAAQNGVVVPPPNKAWKDLK